MQTSFNTDEGRSGGLTHQGIAGSAQEVKAMAAKISAARRLARRLAEERSSNDGASVDDEEAQECAAI